MWLCLQLARFFVTSFHCQQPSPSPFSLTPLAFVFYRTRHKPNVFATRYHVRYSHIVNILPCLFHSSCRFIGDFLCARISSYTYNIHRPCVYAFFYSCDVSVWIVLSIPVCVTISTMFNVVCARNIQMCVINTLVFVRCIQICRCLRSTVFVYSVVDVLPNVFFLLLRLLNFCARLFCVRQSLFFCCSRFTPTCANDFFHTSRIV